MVDVGYGSWSCKNSNARRARRNILEKLRVMRIDDSADMQLDAVLENCIFYIFPMYEFLHSLGQNLPWRPFFGDVRSTPISGVKADVRIWQFSATSCHM